MRCLGRYTIRPFPSSSTDDCYSIGSVVDAWWCDSWWEGIVVTINVCGDGTFRVYFPGNLLLLLLLFFFFNHFLPDSSILLHTIV